MANRESIMNSLFTLLEGVVFSGPVAGQLSWQTTSRKLRLWGDVPPTSQPAMYLAEHREAYEQLGKGQMRRTGMRATIFAYAYAAGDDEIGGTYINNMLDGIEAALAPDDIMAGVLTLGGQVQWCRVEGEIIKDPGDLDKQALLMIPIHILLP